MIRPEDVADLQPGDVVRVSIEGPIERVSEELRLPTGQTFVWGDGTVASWVADHVLTVVSRAPRLYVNSDRTEPVDGDIAWDRIGDVFRRSGGDWYMAGSALARKGLGDFAPLTLLVDGSTGEVVQ